MASVSTPVGKLFEILKKWGGISYREAALRLLSNRPLSNGVTPASRANDRVWLSRYVVHAPLEAVQEAYFADYGESALNIVSVLKSRQKNSLTNQQIIDEVCEDAGPSLERMLAADGQDTSLMRNLLARLRSAEGMDESARAEAAMVLLVAVGCSGSAQKGASYAIDYMRSLRGVDVVTPIPGPATEEQRAARADALEEASTLGLLRVADGYVVGAPHWLSPEPGSETEVGALAVKEGSLRNVGDDVSKRHARIWRAEDGCWYIEGLGSRNGITLVDGADRTTKVVEPPAADRAGSDWKSEPVLLRPGDEVTFGADTRFIVIAGVAE